MPKTVIYARLPINGKHDFSDCYQFIKNKDYELLSQFIDIGENGYDFDRPEFNRMMLFVKEGVVDLIVAPTLLEFSRDISKAAKMIKEIKSYGCSIHFCDIKGVSEDFVGLLDDALNENKVTYGKEDIKEDELHSKHEDMEIYMDDFQVVDKSLFDEEEETDD